MGHAKEDDGGSVAGRAWEREGEGGGCSSASVSNFFNSAVPELCAAAMVGKEDPAAVSTPALASRPAACHCHAVASSWPSTARHVVCSVLVGDQLRRRLPSPSPACPSSAPP